MTSRIPPGAPGTGLGWARPGSSGISLCVIAGAICLYMLFRGIQFLDLGQLVTHPLPSLNQEKSGGFLDPILGTLILTLIGILIAAPVGVAIAVWLSEYGRPAGLAQSG